MLCTAQHSRIYHKSVWGGNPHKSFTFMGINLLLVMQYGEPIFTGLWI